MTNIVKVTLTRAATHFNSCEILETSMENIEAGHSKSTSTSTESDSNIDLPSLKSLYKVSVMERKLGNLIPHMSKASYSLKYGKALINLRVSLVVTGDCSEASMDLQKLRKTVTAMVENYLMGKESVLMIAESTGSSESIFHLLIRLRDLGWKRWKCILSLDLSSKYPKFVVPGVGSSTSRFIERLVTKRLQLPEFSPSNPKYIAILNRHMSTGGRPMSKEKLSCLCSSRLAFRLLQTSNHPTLSLSKIWRHHVSYSLVRHFCVF